MDMCRGASVPDLLMVLTTLVYGRVSVRVGLLSRHIRYDIGDGSRVKFWQDG